MTCGVGAGGKGERIPAPEADTDVAMSKDEAGGGICGDDWEKADKRSG